MHWMAGPGLARRKQRPASTTTYVFMVTDPSGKTLLSTDRAGCRQFVVAGGIITACAVTPARTIRTDVDRRHDGAVDATKTRRIPWRLQSLATR
jgi:hypothetical protein